MAHFAEIDNNNNVLRVIVVADKYESNGAEWCNNLLGGTWVQTSYNNNIRYNYAGIGFTYDATRDAFIPPKCHDEATLDEATCLWNCTNEDHKPLEIENV